MSVSVRVLLVDDNSTVLAMLRQALDSPVTSISTATDAADALLQVVDDPVDLIVSDYHMPGMDGRQLLQKVKSRPATARIPVVLLASKADIADKLRGALQDSVEDFIEKPFFLRDAVQRVKRIVDRIALEKMAREAPTSDGVIRGTLAQMNVIDLLQSLELGRKSCLLTLTQNGDRCELYFAEGQIVHGAYGTLKGDAAVYKVIAWPGGNFQIDFAGESSEQSTTLSTQALLMEGLRLLDEANRDADEETSESAASPTPTPTPAALTPAVLTPAVLTEDEADNVLEA